MRDAAISKSSKQNISLLDKTINSLNKANVERFHNPSGFIKLLDSSLDEPNNFMHRDAVIKAYSELYFKHAQFIGEEALISRNKCKALIRKTVCRGLMFLIVGTYVLAAYWIVLYFHVSTSALRVPF
ncbi:hypothetical protein [Vibrio mediterranei]|uniref:hypothetical protein n=1 Tax=Vibrio mediterranei TaxID=689 RepID=UPI00148C3E29|nr:hypothetical protein [Vibrio mediterranei]NOH31649.1 hypothetical protein [Vibrio mediterranei]